MECVGSEAAKHREYDERESGQHEHSLGRVCLIRALTLSARGPSFNTNHFFAGLGWEFKRKDPVDPKRLLQGVEMAECNEKRRPAPAFQTARGDRPWCRPARASFVFDPKSRSARNGLLEGFPSLRKRDRLASVEHPE